MNKILLVALTLFLTPVTVGTSYKYTDNAEESSSTNQYYQNLRMDVITQLITNLYGS